jgi:hypothetical protein
VPIGEVAWLVVVTMLQVETVAPGAIKSRPGTTAMSRAEVEQIGPPPMRT